MSQYCLQIILSSNYQAFPGRIDYSNMDEWDAQPEKSTELNIKALIDCYQYIHFLWYGLEKYRTKYLEKDQNPAC